MRRCGFSYVGVCQEQIVAQNIVSLSCGLCRGSAFVSIVLTSKVPQGMQSAIRASGPPAAGAFGRAHETSYEAADAHSHYRAHPANKAGAHKSVELSAAIL